MKEMSYGRGYVYSLQYHIVWCVKYRRDILTDEIENDFKTIINDIARQYNIIIIEMKTDKNYVHLQLECKPQHYIPDIVKIFKGVSAKALFEKHPEIREYLVDKHLWNSSYFVVTGSDDIDNEIEEYINIQKQEKRNQTSNVLEKWFWNLPKLTLKEKQKKNIIKRAKKDVSDNE